MLPMKRQDARAFLFLSGSFFIAWMAFTLGVSVLGFALGGGLSWWQSIAGFVLAAGYQAAAAFRLRPDHPKKSLVLSLCFVLALTLVSTLFTGIYIDTSYDGRAYHQNTLIQLATGWNPVEHPLDPDGRSPAYEPLPRSPWTVYFPKSAEANAAAFYKVTGRIQDGKVFNILLLYAAFALTLYSLLGFNGVRSRTALFFAALAAVNPVTVCTLFTYYVDGHMASLLTSLFALVLVLLREKRPLALAPLGLALVLAINTKFPGLGYGFFLSGGLLAGFLLMKEYRWVLKAGAACLLAGVIGFGVVGFNPYVTNWKNYGHPLHPAYGEKAFKGHDLGRFLSIPANLVDKNRFEKFFISLISRSDYVAYPKATRPKIPFTVTAEEVAQFGNTTIRAGGFGPWFGGIFLLTLPLLVAGFFVEPKRSRLPAGFILLVALTIFINPQCWWARLTPQVWLLPLIVIFLLNRLAAERKAARHLAALLLALTVLNLVLVLGSNFIQQTGRTLLMHGKLKHIARAERGILLMTGAFPSTRALLAERGIRFREVQVMPEGVKALNLDPGVKYAFPEKRSP